MRKRVEKGETHHISFRIILVNIPIKNESKNHQKNDLQKTWNLLPKRSQNGTKIDAQTQSKINAKTCNEKHHEKHEKSCFSEW